MKLYITGIVINHRLIIYGHLKKNKFKILIFLFLNELYNIYFQCVAIFWGELFLGKNLLWYITFQWPKFWRRVFPQNGVVSLCISSCSGKNCKNSHLGGHNVSASGVSAASVLLGKPATTRGVLGVGIQGTPTKNWKVCEFGPLFREWPHFAH